MLDIDALVESDGLYLTSMPDGRSFTWRLLTLKEYRVFRALRDSGTLTPMQVHDKVFDRCYQGNADMIDPDCPAGYPMSIGQLIMWLSGDCAATTDKEDLETVRAVYPADTLHEYMKRVCLQAFPSYTIENIEKWTRPLLLQRFVLAESLLLESGSKWFKEAGGYQPLELKSIMSAEQKAKTEKRQQGIDFGRENAAHHKAMNGMEGNDMLDLAPDQFSKKMRIAQKMDGRQRRG